MPVMSSVSLLLFTALVQLTLSIRPEKRLGEPPSESDPEALGPSLSPPDPHRGQAWVKMLTEEKA